MLAAETASDVSAARFHRRKSSSPRGSSTEHPADPHHGIAGDVFYYIMPYVAGESLRHRLGERGQDPRARGAASAA
jgi:hypothetical protein